MILSYSWHINKNQSCFALAPALALVLMQLRFSNGDVFPRPRSEALDISSRQTLHTFSGRLAAVFNNPTLVNVNNDATAKPMPVFGRRGDIYVTAEKRAHSLFLEPSADDVNEGVIFDGEFFPNYRSHVLNGMREEFSSVNVSSTTSVPQIQNLGASTDPAIEQGDNFYLYNYALGETYISFLDRLARPLSLHQALLQPCPVGTAEDANGNCTVTSTGARSDADFGPKVLLRNDYALGISNNDGSYIQYRCLGNGTRAVIKDTNTDGTLDVVCVQCSDLSTPSAQGACAASVTAQKITPRYTSYDACPLGTAEDVYLNCTITESGKALGLRLQGEWEWHNPYSIHRELVQCSDPGTYAYITPNWITPLNPNWIPTCMYCPNFEQPSPPSSGRYIPFLQPQCPAYEAVYYTPCPAGTVRGERGTCLRYSNCPAGSQPLPSNPAFCMVTQEEQFLQGNAPRTSRMFAPPNALLAARSVAGQGSTFPPWRAHIVGGTNAASISRL
jgi:hypothetical protein